MSNMHRGMQAAKAAAPWYYRPMVYLFRLAKYPLKFWRRYRHELGPVLAIQAGKWNMRRVVDNKVAVQKGYKPGKIIYEEDPYGQWGPMRKGWLYDRYPGYTPSARSYTRPANGPRSTEWKPEDA